MTGRLTGRGGLHAVCACVFAYMCVNNAPSDVRVTIAMEIMGEICFENAFRQNEKRANRPLQEVQ